MSVKQVTVCDGCGRTLEKTSRIYHLALNADRFWSGADSHYLQENLDFCYRCAQQIKDVLLKIAERGKADAASTP